MVIDHHGYPACRGRRVLGCRRAYVSLYDGSTDARGSRSHDRWGYHAGVVPKLHALGFSCLGHPGYIECCRHDVWPLSQGDADETPHPSVSHFWDKLKNSFLGTLIDAFAIIAVAAGTIGPIGFLGLQASYGLSALFGIPDQFSTQLAIIVCLVIVSTISAATGLHKGIQILSNFNVRLAIGLVLFVLLFGPGGFIVDSFISSFGFYVDHFIQVSTFRSDKSWLGSWTVFFWGWFIGYGPMMAILVSRISRGRTIRQIILAIAIIAPIVTTFWFTVVGGSGIFYELQNPGSVSQELTSGGMPAAMIAITNQLPLSGIISPLFLLLTILFVVTTGDSMSYTIAMAVSGEGDPKVSLRVFWSILMGSIAAILLYIGDGSVTALQNFIVVTAVPVSLLLLPMLWVAPKVSKELRDEQSRTK